MLRARTAAKYLHFLLARDWASSSGGFLPASQQQAQQGSWSRAPILAATASAAAIGGALWAQAEQAVHPTGEASPEHQAAQRAKANEATAQWRIYTDVGRDLVAQGRYQEAERYFRKALDMAKLGFGEQEAHVASSLNNLAEFYRIRRQYDLAEPLYQQALDILLKEYGRHDARVAFAMHNLGGFYLLQKNLAKAAETYEEALKVKLEVLGPAHSETSNTLQHLAEVRWQQGRRKDAAALLQQSLDIMEGQGVGATAGCLRRRARLAEMLLDMGELDEAEKLLRRVLEYVEAAHGVDDANTATAAENLAIALGRKGEFEEARRLMQRALDARLEHSGQRHPVIAVTLRKMAELELEEAQRGPAGGAGAGGEAAVRALALAQQAQEVAQQAYAEARAAESDTLPAEGGGLGSWFRRKDSTPLLKRMSQHADLAAIELAATWRTLSKAQAANGREEVAVESMQQALTLLTAEWPKPVAQEEQQEQPDMELTAQQAEQQQEGVPSPVTGSSKDAAAATAAAGLARREQARRRKVEGLRQDAVCATLREMAGVLQRVGRGGEAKHVLQRLQDEGCQP